MKRLNWLDILNTQAEWHHDTQMQQWLAAIFGYQPKLVSRSLGNFEETIVLMRSVIDSLHFGEELQVDWLDKRLAKLTPSVTLEKFLPAPLRAAMPLFHASVTG